MGKNVYFGAALFNLREWAFNNNMCNLLERRGDNVILPQRDGFEFRTLAKKLSERSGGNISNDLYAFIYLLDMGYFIPKVDVVVANYDEPIDEGVVAETTCAKAMGKKSIGFRTDSRAPFGNFSTVFKGMHSFPAYQCDTMLFYSEKFNVTSQVFLAAKLHEVINSFEYEKIDIPPNYRSLVSLGSKLFDGINLRSETGIEKLVKTYTELKPEIDKHVPKIIYLD
jgi:nucleoside 2-deoxyribosyltransferase